MTLDQRIRDAEARLFARGGLHPKESFLDLASARVRLRVLSVGAGPPLVLLHGVSLAAAVWETWLAHFAGYRALLVELPGHGLSGPVAYRPGAVRDHALRLLDDIFDRLGAAVLRSPMPRPVYRVLLGQGLSPAAAAAAPDDLLDVLRLAGRRPGNARTVASLMHAIDSFRSPRPESVMTDGELGQITVPTMFCWGTEDPFLAPAQARPAIAKIRGAVLHEVPGGHGPWLEDPAGCARLAIGHFTATGYAPAGTSPSNPAPDQKLT